MSFYLILVVVLVALAVADLVVGVSNDAANFLNSAVGSKVAPKYIILFVASLGVLAGAVFSNGMMEVARNGIFHPQHFYFSEIMLIFIAVMITDILLLDFFNTIGLPTSTTVSIVFELLGAAVAVSIVKLSLNPEPILVNGILQTPSLADYINSSKALSIVSSILLSVVISFSVGFFVQWISRVIFTFNFERPIKYFGAIWGGFAVACIVYFMLIKGLKDTSFVSKEALSYIKEHTWLILGFSFASLVVLFQLLYWLFKVNILKIIVLVGTFSLAMAFAGNDLVNFIGVPLAGYQSYDLYQAAGAQENLLMSGLAGKVETPQWFLIVAGLVMVATLWFSKKAKAVTDTEVKLSRQDEGEERFGSSVFARLLVRRVITSGTFFSYVIPSSFTQKIKSRFDKVEYEKALAKQKNPPSYDLIRASVNLTVAAILIAMATSLKLPLSTTYVTFMVAMGTSLADGAWGRDSAVYRITGVLTVIGGWFMTAITAFTISFLVGLFFSWNKEIAFGVMAFLVLFLIYRSQKEFKRRQADVVEDDSIDTIPGDSRELIQSCATNTNEMLTSMSNAYKDAIVALSEDNHKSVKKVHDDIKAINKKAQRQKDNVLVVLPQMKEIGIEAGKHYAQVLDFQKEMSQTLRLVINPIFNHVDNNHKPISEDQKQELNSLSNQINSFIEKIATIIDKNEYSRFSEISSDHNELLEGIEVLRKKQIKRIKSKESGTKNSLLYLNIMVETRNMSFKALNTLKALRELNISIK